MPQTPAPLPTVTAVELLPGQAACLTLDTGHTIHLSPDTTPRPLFLRESDHGLPLLLTDWNDPDATAALVPEPHAAAVATLFPQGQP